MREILFRGKRLDGGEWIFGYLLVEPSGRAHIETYAPTGAYWDSVEVDPDTVGQYTGLLDKTGKKIFEGDCVRTKYGRICMVVWRQNTAKWIMLPADDSRIRMPMFLECWEADNNEVIGNRWDNPELLKEADK